MVPCASPVAPWFFWLLNLLWALELDALRGPSQRALSHMMVLWVDKLVALATFHPRNLVFWWPQPLFQRTHSTTASHVIAVPNIQDKKYPNFTYILPHNFVVPHNFAA